MKNSKRPQVKDEASSSGLRRWFHYFGQDQAQVAWPERIRATIGALIGLFCTVALGRMLGELVGVNEWVMASLGASALLIFVLPSSPMAQPWAVVVGNMVSAVVGVACARWIPHTLGAGAAAVALAILAGPRAGSRRAASTTSGTAAVTSRSWRE